ncbi:MAG: M48 family metalloprotease [Candidatus Omnitrophica bacterium]|nr:M48 family metalloprotease [Candidatus Omnitrophota bacterium]
MVAFLSKRDILFLSFVAAFFLTGCGTLVYNSATQRREFITISTQEEINMGKSIHQGVLKGCPLSMDKTQVDRLNRVGEKVALVSDRQDYKYKFFLIEKNELNAFTTPGGNIYVYTGLMHQLTSDDELAGVVAHEIGHCAARHVVKKFQASRGYDAIRSVLGYVRMGAAARYIASWSSNILMNLVFSSYSRQDEYEADRLGIKYMYLAGFNPDGMIQTLGILKKESKGPQGPVILRSHPYLEDRIKAAQDEVVKVRKQFS